MANYGQTHKSIMEYIPRRKNDVQVPIVNTDMNTVRNNYGQAHKTIMSYVPPTTYIEGAPIQVQQGYVPYTGNPAAVYDVNHFVGYPSRVPHVVNGTPVNVGNYRFLGGGGMTADLYNQVAVDTLNALRLLGGGAPTTTPRSGGTSRGVSSTNATSGTGRTPTAPTTKTAPSAETKPTPQTLSNVIQPVFDTIPTFDPKQDLGTVAQQVFTVNSAPQVVSNPNNTTQATFGTQPAYAPQQAFNTIQPDFSANNVTQAVNNPNNVVRVVNNPNNVVRAVNNPNNVVRAVNNPNNVTQAVNDPSSIAQTPTVITLDPNNSTQAVLGTQTPTTNAIENVDLGTTGQFLSKVFTELDAMNEYKTLADIITAIVNDPNSRTAVANTPNAIPFTVPIPVRETTPVTETLPIEEPMLVAKPLPTTENKMLAPVQFTPNLLRELINIESARQFLPLQ